MSPLFFCVLLCFVQSPNKHSYKSPNPEFALHRKSAVKQSLHSESYPQSAHLVVFLGFKNPRALSISPLYFSAETATSHMNSSRLLLVVVLPFGSSSKVNTLSMSAKWPDRTLYASLITGSLSWSFGSLTYDPPCFRSLLTASFGFVEHLNQTLRHLASCNGFGVSLHNCFFQL